MRTRRFFDVRMVAAFVIGLFIAIGSSRLLADDKSKADGGTEAREPKGEPSLPDAKSLVFILDASGSMISTIDAAKKDMGDSIEELKDGQFFNIVIIGVEESPAFQKKLVTASAKTKKAALTFLKAVQTQGTGHTPPALKAAFKLRPEAILLYSDFDFPEKEDIPAVIKKLNTQKRPVFTIFLSSTGVPEDEGSAKPTAQHIAEDSKGVYRCIRVDTSAK